MPDFLFDERDDMVDPEQEAHEDELGAAFGDARRCPRHPGVKTSSDDGMFDCDCYQCEGEEQDAHEAYMREQDEFLHPIECIIARTIRMGEQAREERARREELAAMDDDGICF